MSDMIHVVDDDTFADIMRQRFVPTDPALLRELGHTEEQIANQTQPRVLICNNHLVLEGPLDRDRIVLSGRGIIDGVCLIPIELAARERVHVLFGPSPPRWWHRLLLRLARWALRRVEASR